MFRRVSRHQGGVPGRDRLSRVLVGAVLAVVMLASALLLPESGLRAESLRPPGSSATPGADAAADRLLHDPTRPPGMSPGRRGAVKVSRWVLTSTLISPDRRLATINGRTVAIGQGVGGGGVVEDIQPTQVRLRFKSRSLEVKLLPGRVKRPVQ